MKDKIFLGIQILTGLLLIMFGLNKFLHFIPMPPPPEAMGAFMGALFGTGYLMTLVAIVEISAGIAFVWNKCSALFAVVLMPVMLNAFLAHLFLDPAGIAAAAVILLFTIVIMIRHKEAYRGLIQP